MPTDFCIDLDNYVKYIDAPPLCSYNIYINVHTDGREVLMTDNKGITENSLDTAFDAASKGVAQDGGGDNKTPDRSHAHAASSTHRTQKWLHRDIK